MTGSCGAASRIAPLADDTPAIRSAGFTLIEMAVAVFVIALLLGSILVPLTTQVEQRQISDVQKALDEIREAIIGYALTKGHLPCPDKTAAAGEGNPNDGLEDFYAAIGSCVATEGNVPWATLGTAGSDARGNRFRYRVHGLFAQRSPAATFTFATNSDLGVCTTSACGTRLTNVTDGPPAVILSHGRNGYLAINENTGVANPCPAGGCSADETANANGDRDFVYRAQSGADAAAGEFDDIVIWLSKNILFNRMVAAGKLP